MLRLLINRVVPEVQKQCRPTLIQNGIKWGPKIPSGSPANFSTLCNQPLTPLLSNIKVQEISKDISRGVTKFSLGKGKRKSVKVVLKKFYRLNWGIWIHAKCGRTKKLWKKHAARKRRLNQHVFCNATQATLLDKMVMPFWKKPKYYVEDPYEPYHTREEFRFTYQKPRPYIPPE